MIRLGQVRRVTGQDCRDRISGAKITWISILGGGLDKDTGYYCNKCRIFVLLTYFSTVVQLTFDTVC